ncbi:thiosulfate oxidation carrier complex protein SoxZ [Methyloradius palustris]|uniref:Thiosulfate oxidation carrier complex protein SoxZ n=2 Tax=Methyloradius palustris TaxID=2778876 RepID=A0A8D5FXP4_9PROT|nr:thiosulfate oxidation carrier complex protein SoxZ [Methyloradius palustris]
MGAANMADDIKMRAQLKGDMVEVKVLIGHPMETGRRKNEAGEVISAHFVQLVTVTLNGKSVLEAQWGTGISKNPYLTFHLVGAKVGDIVAVTWHDNLGQSSSQQIAVTQG